jgi:hypothetical protein
MTFDTFVGCFVISGLAFNNDMFCMVVHCVRCVVWCNMHWFGRDMVCGTDATHCKSGIHGFRCWAANRGSCQDRMQKVNQCVCATSVIITGVVMFDCWCARNATASKTYKIFPNLTRLTVLRFIDMFVDVVGDFSLVLERLHFLGKMGIILHHQYCVQHKTFVLCPWRCEEQISSLVFISGYHLQQKNGDIRRHNCFSSLLKVYPK